MRAPEFWAKPHDLRTRLLGPLGDLYGQLGRLRRRWVAPRRVSVPVICIGNLTVGGAGKTPTVMAIARHLIDQGHAVHLLTRGYGGRARGPLRVDPALQGASQVGDEALLLAEVAPTWLARDRALGAEAAAAAGADIVIMDDGLQNPHLAPDLALVVVDGGYGFGNRRLLPAGPLREAIADGFSRASAVVRIGPDETGVNRVIPDHLPLLEAELQPSVSAPQLVGHRVLAFAGMGRPAKFFATLEAAGAEVVGRRSLADHHPYTNKEMEALCRTAERLKASLVTTTKDWVRIPPEHQRRVAVLPIELVWRDAAAIGRLLTRVHTRSP